MSLSRTVNHRPAHHCITFWTQAEADHFQSNPNISLFLLYPEVSWLNWCLTGSCLFSLVLILFFRESYDRLYLDVFVSVWHRRGQKHDNLMITDWRVILAQPRGEKGSEGKVGEAHSLLRCKILGCNCIYWWQWWWTAVVWLLRRTKKRPYTDVYSEKRLTRCHMTV